MREEPVETRVTKTLPSVGLSDPFCIRFEAAWQAGVVPRIEDYLGLAPDQDGPTAEFRQRLVALVAIDLRFRWRSSPTETIASRAMTESTVDSASPLPSRPRLEDYLRRYPALGPLAEVPESLVLAEYQARHAYGDMPSHVEYRERFPALAARLDELLAAASVPQAGQSMRLLTPPTLEPPLHPAIGLDEFLARLVASRLLPQEQLRAFCERLAPEERPQDGRALAERLVAAGRLTRYQAEVICQGQAKGLVLGDYVILDKLGAGGMGQVFKAQHRAMERVVALKILSPRLMDSPDAVLRFRREVKAAARLIHPNIVIAHDAGEQEGMYYLVTEYVDGEDLGKLAQRGPLPVEQAVGYILQTALGLEYAHQHGVIHRDIKPSNLLVDRNGTVKILDMGLARLDEPQGPENATSSERLTSSSQVMGTWEYIAPEQAIATSKADHRSDTYSLGCALYRLLTGHAPYRGSSMLELFLAHREAPIPSLRDARKEVPEWLETVYEKMVAKQPEDRYQSMKEVVAALEGCLANPSSAKEFTASAAVAVSRTSPQTKGANSRRFAILAGTVLGLGLIVLLLFALRPARHPTSAASAPQASEGHPPSPLGQQPMTKQEAVAWVFLTGGWIFERGGAAPYASPDQVPTNEPLHKVHLYRNRQIKDEDLARLKWLPPLRELSIEYTAITDAGLVHLIGLKNLQRVALTGSKVTAEGVERLRTAMPQCQILWDPPATASPAQDRIAWEALRELIAWVLKKGGTISEAQALRNFRSPDDATPDMIRFRVTFRHQHFFDEDLARLSQFPSIIDLHLDGTDLTDRGLEHLRKWPILGCLLLHDTAITDAGAEQLALVPTILSFGLEGTGITDQGVARIASAHRRVRGIELSRTQVSDAALKTLVPCQSLTRLTLAKTKVTDAGLSSLAELKHLAYLDLNGSRVTEAGVARLRQSLPNCKILWKPEPPVSDLLKNGPPLANAPFDASTARRHQAAWAQHLGVPAEMTNSIEMKLVLIPPGEFDMGTDRELMADRISSQPGSRLVFEGSRPQHRVRITTPFYLGACEVRQIEFQRVMETNPSDYSPQGTQRNRVTGNNSDQYPVENLHWADAREFCRRLSERPAERAAGRQYRLPTEAEWEYACRAGSARRYVFGDTIAATADYAWPWDHDHRMNHPVALKKPNPWGLYDMLGNVLEFCADYYDQPYYQQSPTVDPPGASTGSARVLRGGYYGSVWNGWHDPGPDCRGYAAPDGSYDFLGVRIVCEVGDAVPSKASSESKH